MLSLNQIKQFYPSAEGISERNMLREYLQYKILATVFASHCATKLSFVGGTAIRIIYGSDRFSEDLDFDHFKLAKEDFSNLTNKVKNAFKNEGLHVETRNVFKDSFRCYLKISGLLFDYGLSRHKEEKILIQLDARGENFALRPDLKIINKFGIFSEIRVDPVDIVLAQKIKAVLTRKRAMGRDLYDIVYLSSLTRPNMEYLEQKLSLAEPEEVKRAMKKKLGSYKKDRLAEDIKPFVADESKLGVVREFDKWLESWLI